MHIAAQKRSKGDKKARTYTGNCGTWRNLTKKSANEADLFTNNLLRQLDNGKLICDDCNQFVRGETAKQHCRAKRHVKAKAKRFTNSKNKSQGKQSSIRAALANSDASQKDAELQACRFVFVGCALKAGISLNAIDGLRPAIDNTSTFKLSAAANLRQLLPVLNKWEKANVAAIVEGKEFAWFHDSATRGNELLAVTVRVLDVDPVTGQVFYRMVLIRLKFLSGSSNRHTLAADQHAALQAMGLTEENAVCANCDACATNLAAVGVLELQCVNTLFALCVAHLGANTGGKLRAPEVDKFFVDFIAVMNHSRGLQKEWLHMTGRRWVGYGGVRWFNRVDVLQNVLPDLGREGKMQQMLTVMSASGSPVVKRLLVQGNYSNASCTEQLHLEVAVSVAVGKMLYNMTYSAENDQLNCIFSMWALLTQIDADFAAILTDGVQDVVTDTVTALHAAGHLKNALATWIAYGVDMVRPTIQYWNDTSRAGKYGDQRRLYEVAHNFIPAINATRTLVQLQAQYERLRTLKFPGTMVDGLIAEAAGAIANCAGVGARADVVNYWHARSEEFPHHAAATKRLALMQPSEASVERVFSRVKSHFTIHQMVAILNDYVETAVMLDYNDRDVAAAWY